ncbi:MAG: class I SAM-dependent methyltransferase [Deinococcales bacterium]
MLKLAVAYAQENYQAKAKALATALALPLIQILEPKKLEGYDLFFWCDIYLSLYDPPSQIRAEFSLKKASQHQKEGKKQALARAMGLHKLSELSDLKVIDATAGLGKDSFVLASLGVEVVMLERSPLILPLLQDALALAQQDPQLSSIVKGLRLIHGEARQIIPQLKPHEVIYLDPMYPDSPKRALPKKEMQIFLKLLRGVTDDDTLLELALAHALKRVVVKRPRHAPHLAGKAASFSLEGESTRYDVYLTS